MEVHGGEPTDGDARTRPQESRRGPGVEHGGMTAADVGVGKEADDGAGAEVPVEGMAAVSGEDVAAGSSGRLGVQPSGG